ncbi:MAG: PQQ-binding-like beta-propeller repeat protein [Pirellulaceae bacterium]
MKHKTIGLLLLLLATSPLSGDVVEQAKSSGIKGGIIVHLGCGDGRETVGLLLNDRYLVHGLDADDAQLREARRRIQKRGLYGPVSVSRWGGEPLPYVNNLVNLLIDSSGGSVTREEILRVLVPGGVAFLGEEKIVKPWPDEIDDWTHFLHGPDNNAVARDRRVGIPRSIQWVSEPRWGRTHEEMASLSMVVAAQGRIYYIVDESPLASIRFLGNWKLVARDAFNGTLLWKKPLASWVDPLRHFRSGPVHLPRRLVAVGDRVYVTLGLAAKVVALDGATGETRLEFQGTERTEEILVDHGILYLLVGSSEVNRRGGGLYQRGEPAATGFRYVKAIDTQSGKEVWTRDFSHEYILPLTMAVNGDRLYFQSAVGIVCLDAQSGVDVWKTPRQTPARRMSFSAPTLVATDEVVLCADRDLARDAGGKPLEGTVEWGVHGWNEPGFSRKAKNTLRAYSVQDGRELWSAECSEGYNSPVDIFVVDDVVWVGSNFQGLDLRTGEPKKRIDATAPRVGMSHPRCYRNKASERFIFTGKSGVEVLSLDKGWLSNNSWIRGTCQYGILPTHGLLYAPPDACACFLTVKAPGFFAAAPQRDKTLQMPFPDQPVLEKGPLYGKPRTVEKGYRVQTRPPRAGTASPRRPGPDDSPSRTSGEWPMYRHDVARSGEASSQIPSDLDPRWRSEIGGKLTQPVIAGGKVFVASIDSHTLYALSAGDGREVWRYTVGGRIDSSPTVYQGWVLFGSADGWIYCLGAADGSLVWRFRAAPRDRLVSVYGQLESVWPVHGAVLVQNGTLYVTAGRSSYLDGGIVLYRMDPMTGEELSKTMLHHLDPKTGEQLVPEARFNMEGTTADILSGDGESVFLKYFAFDREGARIESTIPHLYSITGLLGEEWFVRSYWLVGAGMPGAGWGGWANAANTFPSGRILCFNDEAVYGYGRVTVAAGPVGHRADAYHLFCQDRKPGSPKIQVSRKGKKKTITPTQGRVLWNNDQKLIVRAMVLGTDRLAVAGPVDKGEKDPDLLAFRNDAEARASFAGQKGVFLRVVSATDGKQISETELPGMPVFDGLSAAGGRLYVSLKDGTVICLEAS